MLRLPTLAFALLAPLTAATAGDWHSIPLRGTTPQLPPCTCRAPGASVALGDEACLFTPSGGRRARCVMVLNNTSWEISTETCGSTAALKR